MVYKKSGFTIIEMIIVVTIVGLIFQLFFNIIFTIAKQQIRVYQMSEIKREGDNVITFLNNRINNGHYVLSRTDHLLDPSDPNYRLNNELCTQNNLFSRANNGEFYFIRVDDSLDNYFRVFAEDEQLRFESTELPDGSELTSDNIIISNFIMECNLTSIPFGSALVTISFTSTHRQQVSPSDPPVSLFYSTKFKLRSN